jgi:hypothetical protein
MSSFSTSNKLGRLGVDLRLVPRGDFLGGVEVGVFPLGEPIILVFMAKIVFLVY